MNRIAAESAMSQKIFTMNLGVETVSLYLLCCAVANVGARITRTTLKQKWNGDGAALDRELSRLVDRNILHRGGENPPGEAVYQIVNEKNWR